MDTVLDWTLKLDDNSWHYSWSIIKSISLAKPFSNEYWNIFHFRAFYQLIHAYCIWNFTFGWYLRIQHDEYQKWLLRTSEFWWLWILYFPFYFRVSKNLSVILMLIFLHFYFLFIILLITYLEPWYIICYIIMNFYSVLRFGVEWLLEDLKSEKIIHVFEFYWAVFAKPNNPWVLYDFKMQKTRCWHYITSERVKLFPKYSLIFFGILCVAIFQYTTFWYE